MVGRSDISWRHAIDKELAAIISLGRHPTEEDAVAVIPAPRLHS